MLTGKSFIEFINLFSPNKYEKDDKIIHIFNNSERKIVKIYLIKVALSHNTT